MIKASVLYPSKPGARFNADYYLNVHMPMAIRALGPTLKAVSAEIGISAVPDQAPLYAAIASFTFESLQAFGEAFAPNQAALVADIPNYTDIDPLFQFSEIGISR